LRRFSGRFCAAAEVVCRSRPVRFRGVVPRDALAALSRRCPAVPRRLHGGRVSHAARRERHARDAGVSGQVEQARETPTRPAGRGHAEARLGAQGRERHEPGVRQRNAAVKTLRAC
jgi:hypothetical protein